MAVTIAGKITDPPVCPRVELRSENVRIACELVIEAMKNGLPGEAHSIEIFDYILRESSRILHCTPIKL